MTTPQLPPVRTPAHFFGEELVNRRERLGWRQNRLAKEARMSPSRVSQIEKALIPATLDNARDLDRALNDPPPGFFERFYEWMNSIPAVPDWFGRYLEFEDRASSIQEYAATVVPGILQTEEYMRALLNAGMVRATGAEIDAAVEKRLQRQEILRRDDCPPLWYLLDEAVLTRPVGGPDVMARQLAHVLELSSEAGSGPVVVQVVPVAVGAHATLGGLLTLLSLPDGPNVAYLEGFTLGQLVEDSVRVAEYSHIYNHVQTQALSITKSADRIRSAMEDMQDDQSDTRPDRGEVPNLVVQRQRAGSVRDGRDEPAPGDPRP
ncbi:helix-turn-helix domain-containing protein [Streptomyces bacillaris]|uniref:helix-turn-helix domain-containing protein n=1 Tax=Streptomyces bacillaris TaxID=68179 RepID=UPI0037F6583B